MSNLKYYNSMKVKFNNCLNKYKIYNIKKIKKITNS